MHEFLRLCGGLLPDSPHNTAPLPSAPTPHTVPVSHAGLPTALRHTPYTLRLCCGVRSLPQQSAWVGSECVSVCVCTTRDYMILKGEDGATGVELVRKCLGILESKNPRAVCREARVA